MKIALFTETFVPKVDGIVTRVTRTVEQLVRQGHEVLVFAPDPGIADYRGARVVGLPWFSLPFYPENRIALPRWRIKRELDAFQPDVVHGVTPFVLGIAGVSWARARRVPLLLSYHVDLPKYFRYLGFGRLVNDLWRCMRAVHKLADVNVCTSTVVADELTAQGFPRVSVWRRAVDAELYHPTRASEVMRSRLTGGRPERRLLMYAGRLSAEKGIADLLPIVERLDDVCLAIVGDGPQRAELEALFSRDRTVFTGYLHGEALAGAYASSDAFVFPSRTETLGLVLLEALATGCPVVASRAGGITDVIDDGRGGFLFQPGDEGSLLDAARRVLDLGRASEFRERARESVLPWSWEAATQEIARYYEQAIASETHRRPATAAGTLRVAGTISFGWGRAAMLGLGVKLGLVNGGTLASTRSGS